MPNRLDIYNSLTPEQKSYYDRHGLHKLVEHYGILKDGNCSLETSMGTLSLRAPRGVKLPFKTTKAVYLQTTGAWKAIIDGLEVRI